jgi:glycerol kinase
MAGLAVGYWTGVDEIAAIRSVERRFDPSRDEAARAADWRRWGRAIASVRGWAADDSGRGL